MLNRAQRLRWFINHSNCIHTIQCAAQTSLWLNTCLQNYSAEAVVNSRSFVPGFMWQCANFPAVIQLHLCLMLIPTEQTRIHPPVTKRKESPGALSCSLQSPSEVLTGALTSLTWLNKIWFGSLPSRLARSTSRDIYDDGVIDAMLRGACRLMFTFWLLRVWFDVMCMFTIWAFKQELRSSISLQHGWKSWAYITGQLDSSSLSLLFYNFLRVLFLMNRVFLSRLHKCIIWLSFDHIIAECREQAEAAGFFMVLVHNGPLMCFLSKFKARFCFPAEQGLKTQPFKRPCQTFVFFKPCFAACKDPRVTAWSLSF